MSRYSSVYRYRSIESLIANKELENSTFYLSEIESLNDPFEGYMKFSFEPDKVARANFLEHYLRCCLAYYVFFHIGDREGISSKEILSPEGIINDLLYDSDTIKRGTSVLKEKVLKNKNFKIIYNFIIFYKKDFNFIEMQFFLKSIFSFILVTVSQMYNEKKLHEQFSLIYLKDENFFEEKSKKDLKKTKDFIDRIRINDSSFNEKEFLKIYFDLTFLDSSFFLEEEYTKQIREFPENFLNNIIKVIDYKSSLGICCFSGNNNNSTMWSHYANNHTGVCLEFPVIFDEKFKKYEIRQSARNYSEMNNINDSKMCTVNYSNNYKNKNGFFHSLKLISDMIKMENFNKSYEIINIIFFKNRKNKKIKIKNKDKDYNVNAINMLNKIENIFTQKTNEWQYENELRIIKRGFFDKKNRIIGYDRKLLKSITFGQKTSQDDKEKIFEIIKNKKSSLNREFKFYQSYMSENGTLDRAFMSELTSRIFSK